MSCLLVGGAARIWGFATSGSLWLDELFIANNLRELSFAELFSPLKYGQNAPVGWLVIQKSIISVFGDREYALRSASLLASLLSLPLAYTVSRKVAGLRYAILPVAIIAFSPFVLWQGLQVKQYTFDLLVSLALLALAIRAERGPTRWLVALGFAGFIGIWISMPSVFVLGGVGLALFVSEVFSRPRNRGRLIRLAAMGGAWVAAFTINYLAFLRPGAQEGWLQHFWSKGFFDWPIDSLSDLWWLPNVLSAAMSNPVGFFKIGLIALVPVLFGLLPIFRRSNRKEKIYLAMAGIPIFVTLFASILNLYPFAVRLVLFLVPSLALCFALGVKELAQVIPRGRIWIHGATFAMVAVPTGLFLLWLPRGGLPIASDTRELVRILEAKVLPADAIVVDHLAYQAWRYYGTYGDNQAIEARSAWNDVERMAAITEIMTDLTETRAWIMFSRVSERKPRSLKQSLTMDLADRNPTLPATYEWFIGKETKWTPIEIYERGLPGDWKIRETIIVYGGCLWLLERDAIQ